MTIERVAIVGLGLIGGSVGLAVQQMLPGMTTTGWDADADVRQRVGHAFAEKANFINWR